MRNDSGKSPDDEKTYSPQPEIDYAPKSYTLRQQIALVMKFVSVVGIIFLMLWFFR